MNEKKPISSSMRFPSNNLETCLNKIKVLFEKNSTNLCSSQAIVLDLGFSGKNGSADSLLASLKYYGLLEKANTDKFKISPFIIDYCISGELNKDIVSQILHSVPINKKIFSTYDIDNLPSDNELKNFLIKTCGYNLKQANTYIDIFNKNFLIYSENNKKNSDEVIKQSLQPAYDSAANLGLNIESILDDKVKAITKNVNASIISYPLSSNQDISIKLPCDIRELDIADLEDIKDVLELVLKKIDNQIKKKTT